MFMQIMQDGTWLAYVFAFLMALAVLIYTVLDGYDLGVGILTARATDAHKDIMIASIGPFWDANETWLILGIGLLLVAFPMAHGIILTHLYLPVALMLFGLIFRGAAFDFRAKVAPPKKVYWNRAFFGGSLLTSLAQGYMLGSYVVGFDQSFMGVLFAFCISFAVATAYALIGACWLIMRTEGALQQKAIGWAKMCLIITTLGLALVSVTTPLVSERIFDRWFSMPELLWLLPVPIITATLVIALYTLLRVMPFAQDRYCWLPFVMTIVLYFLGFIGIAYSFFPYLVPETMTIVQAAATSGSLLIMLVGALLVLPMLIGYTVLVYRIFRGKATLLSYD